MIVKIIKQNGSSGKKCTYMRERQNRFTEETVRKKEKCRSGQERIIEKGQGNLDQGERTAREMLSSSEMKEKGEQNGKEVKIR